MTDPSSQEQDSRPEPGFIVCGAMVLAAQIGLGIVASVISQVTGYQSAITIVGIAAVVAAIVLSIRDRRFGRLLLKGIVAWLAFSVIVFGACLAILAGSGLTN